MGYLTATATESLEPLNEDASVLKAEAQAIAAHFQTWESAEASSEEKKEAKSFLRLKGIIVEDRYKQSDIDRAWGNSLIAVTRSVVRINKINAKVDDNSKCKPTNISAGTGTLINVGILNLCGRVVVTCGHCVLPGFSSDDGVSSTAVATMGDKILSANSQNLQKLIHFSRKPLQSGQNRIHPPGFNQNKNSNLIRLSITTECQQGQMTNIPITDIYILAKDQNSKECYDICVIILGKPVECNEEIVPGIDLNRLNVITDSINVSQESPFHICWKNSNNFSPIAIGYGNTGIYNEPKSFSYLDRKTSNFITGSGTKKAIVLRGLDLNFTNYKQNMKACRCAQYLKRIEAEAGNIILQGALKKCMDRGFKIERLLEDVESQYKSASNIKNRIDESKRSIYNLQSARSQRFDFVSLKRNYNLAKTQLESVKKKLESMLKDTLKAVEEAKNSLNRGRTMAPFFAGSQAGSGFSGSLVFRVKKDIENNEDNEDNEDKNYDVFGIFSGPLFTEEIKSFIKNAAHHYNQNQVN
ncbi:MAG: hypothetical protein LBB11_01215 [Puniceicoccales bacterium]|jgi:hypothetical protein|nr:hypothetical protein [Puniceicoccales bacterium]